MRKPAKIAPLRIRPGTVRDIPAIVSLIRALAKYERLTRYCKTNAKRLRRDGFGRRRFFETLICTRGGRPIGYAVYYFAYSTFGCTPVLFIEDILCCRRSAARAPAKPS